MTIDSSNEENYVIDLVYGPDNEKSWTGNSGQSYQVKFTFDSSLNFTGIANVDVDDLSTTVVTGDTASQRASAVIAMQSWADVANISFTEDNTNYAMVFAINDIQSAPINGQQNASATTYTTTVGSTITHVDVFMDDSKSAAGFDQGELGYFILLHEIGHSLGLSHPGGNPTNLNYNNDLTAMSYREGVQDGGFTSLSSPLLPYTPMVYDIAAIQFLYGANYSYNSTNTVYDLSDGSTKVWTIWDGYGDDSISAANDTIGSLIDLHEGVDTYNKVGNNIAFIAFGANIEHAEGGTGADTIIGNDLDNYLLGNSGADTLVEPDPV